MNLSYLIDIFVVLKFVRVRGLEIFETPNVKTVLFNELDVRRSCWNNDDINLLHARMIMQDLIPKKVPRDIPYLLDYLRSTQEAVVKRSPNTKVRRIMMLALSDILGGYLQAVAIPIAKEAYYAGNIDYATMSSLYELLNEMKSRLLTDGGTWSRPIDTSTFSTKVTALHLTYENSELACKAMFVTPAEKCAPGVSRVAIPYLDYDEKPGAVALPLKSRNLYSLKTAASSHIIVRFYILARQCLSEMPPSETELFNFQFIRWLTLKVLPHLYEDVWYPGFGSVMRIVETVNETQVAHHGVPLYVSNDTSLEKALLHPKSCGFYNSIKDLLRYNSSMLFLIIFLVLISLLLCCCCIFVASRTAREHGGVIGTAGAGAVGGKSSSGILNAVLSIYCGLKDNKDNNFDQQQSVNLQEPRFSRNQPPTAYPPARPVSDTSTIPSSSEDEESITSSTT